MRKGGRSFQLWLHFLFSFTFTVLTICKQSGTKINSRYVANIWAVLPTREGEFNRVEIWQSEAYWILMGHVVVSQYSCISLKSGQLYLRQQVAKNGDTCQLSFAYEMINNICHVPNRWTDACSVNKPTLLSTEIIQSDIFLLICWKTESPNLIWASLGFYFSFPFCIHTSLQW